MFRTPRITTTTTTTTTADKSKATTTATGSSKTTTTSTSDFSQQNQKALNDYLYSNRSSTKVYQINGKDSYITDISDNGDSTTITYWDKEEYYNSFNPKKHTITVDK